MPSEGRKERSKEGKERQIFKKMGSLEIKYIVIEIKISMDG